MNRTVRWGFYGNRQKAIALAAVFGCSTATGLTAWQTRTVLQAEGDTSSKETQWTKSPEIVSNEPAKKRHESWESSRTDLPRDATHSQKPPSQTKDHSNSDLIAEVHKEQGTAWKDATARVGDVADSFTGFDFSTLRTKIANTVLPDWLRSMPDYVQKLRDELSGAPWSLGWEIWEEAHDPEINPEILWDAHVRVSDSLCPEEQDFLAKRQKFTTKALAKYLDVPEKDVHPEDVPIIAMCGSGGGLRALVAGASSFCSAQEAGLLDCVTYTSGVSGSCWLQTLYFSSIGRQNHSHIINHLKERLGVHIAYPPAALSLLNQAPTNKFLLSGFVEKLRGVPDADFGIVDVYGLLLAARLLVPQGDLGISDRDLKLSNQRTYTDSGKYPLPIYTAVRHEIPGHVKDHLSPSKLAWHNTKHYDWFQWFEWTPYELFCEELECGIPTWAVGRKWQGGDAQWRENDLALPELRVPLMMGIWGSAFCATLSHYYKEIQPLIKAGGLGKLDTVLAGKDDDLVKVHPIDPAVIPNFILGMRDRLPGTIPDSMHETSHLQLMDAGMSNNLPIYPLLRPGRKVDMVIAFDASADVKSDNWVKVVDGYVRQRNIRGWPMGAGWPPEKEEIEETVSGMGDAQATSGDGLDALLSDDSVSVPASKDLGYCNIWVGTVEERQEFMDEPPGRRITTADDEDPLRDRSAGLTLVYFPFVKNDKVPDVDPAKSDFMSTWNFVYTPSEIDQVVALAEVNFDAGKEQTRRAVRAVWERKRALRLQREKDIKNDGRLRSARRATSPSKGDQFNG